MTTVEPGSVWADNYSGNKGRTIRVNEVAAQYAYCTVLTNPTKVQDALDSGRNPWGWKDVRGRETRVLLSSFSNRPRQRGYRPADTPRPTSDEETTDA